MRLLIIKYFKHLICICLFYLFFYSILSQINALNPIQKVLRDFKFSDIYFSHFLEKEKDRNIYLIDIGLKSPEITRNEITKFINEVNDKYKPRVIAIDVRFLNNKNTSTETNVNLINALKKDNIVLPYSLQYEENENGPVVIEARSELPINYNKVSLGFTNNFATDNVEYSVSRFFTPVLNLNNKIHNHFSYVVSKKFNPDSIYSFDKGQKIMINYKYEYDNPISINDNSSYFKLKDKIVIIGLFTKKNNGDPLYNEDVHYTPSKKPAIGKSPPNLYGAEILANIISNINNQSYIKYYEKTSIWINICLSLVIYFVLLFIYNKSSFIFSVTSIVQQFFLVFFLVLSSIFIIAKFNIYMDFTLLVFVTFFSVEFVGFIDEVVAFLENLLVNLHLKTKLK